MCRLLSSFAMAAVLLSSLWLRPEMSTAAHASSTGGQLTSGSQVDAYLTQEHFHGYVLFTRHGQTILSKGYGMADAARKRPNTIQTRWPMFGIQGFMIAIATLRLQEEGKVHVTDRICAYLSGCPAAWRPITIQEVLLGTSGIGYYNPYAAPGSSAGTFAACQHLPLASTPGTPSPDDSPCNRIVLSVVLAKAAGKPFAMVLKDTVFRPAGMVHTDVATGGVAPAQSVHGYTNGSPGLPFYSSGYPLVYASIADVQRLDRALLGGKLLAPRSLRALLTPYLPAIDPTGVVYLGYQCRVVKANAFPFYTTQPSSPLKTNRVIMLGGGGPDGSGLSLQHLFSPDDGALAVVVVNDSGFFPGDAEDHLRDGTVQLLWAR